MAFSPLSRYRSRIIRDTSQDLEKTQHSCASSTGSNHGTVSDSTISDFDPENEAIMSTRQVDLNYSQRLPELRDTAKKYGRWSGNRQPDIAINTSAIGRAFPDFSQGGSSDDSMSIEVGRGAKARQRTANQQTRPHYADNIDSPVVTIGDFQILSTPPMKSQSKLLNQQDALRSSVRKESQIKRVSSVQKENVPPTTSSEQPKKIPGYISGASRTASGEQRRTLAELHARVADESDGSFISDERPATVTFAAKSSRFSNAQHRNSPLSNTGSKSTREPQNNNSASRYKVSQTQAHTPSKLPNNGTLNSNTFNPTNQSFLLPNMPDISELVSGTFKDGTPVFTRSGKVQSRFLSNGNDFKSGYNGIDGIPVPQEEKDIFLSLQLLQEKVDSLEMEKAKNQSDMEDLQRDVYQLEAEKNELLKHRRSDSALGMGDSGSDEDYARDNQKLVAEKTKVEAQLKSVHNRLETTDRKVSTLELRLKTNTAERDQAVKQLTEAFYSSEQLKTENESLQKENESLKEQLALFIAESEENTRRWQQKESTLRQKLQRREEAVLEIREMTREIQETHHESIARTMTTRASDSTNGRGGKGKRISITPEIEQRVNQRVTSQSKNLNEQEINRGRTSSGRNSGSARMQTGERMKSRSISRSHRFSKDDRAASNKRESAEHDYEEEISGSDASNEGSLDENTKTIHKNINVNGGEDEFTHGSNYSSILGHGEMDRLRKILADERAKQQERIALNAAADAEGATVRSTRSVGSAPGVESTLQRKSSTKGLTGILKNRSSQDQEDITGHLSNKSGDRGQDHTKQSNISHQRRHSENSVSSSIKSRRPITAEEMTSAFILPDITLHNSFKSNEHQALSADARRVLDKLAHHDGHNCTVCARVASFDTKESTNFSTNQKILITKPVPVSDRMPAPGPYEDEPTMRPASTPGLALATVMKALEDELAHLKMELAQYQAMYNKHDASLSMRKRKSLKAKIENLLKTIDTKADQIYNLYDVLEGQKHSGQELSEIDVETTLQSLGVDVEKLHQDKSRNDKEKKDEDEDEDSDLDLPWEGIEDTAGTEKSGNNRRQSWRM